MPQPALKKAASSSNFYATAKTLGFDIDFKRLLKEF